jgi:Berberine and berberine like
MDIIRAVTPQAGSYVNETDYHEPDWQHSFWGDNYPRLLEVKHKYDPGKPVPRPPRRRQRDHR